MAASPDAVAFPKGTHTYECELGRAVVHAPRDITAAEIAPAVRRYLERRDDGTENPSGTDAAQAAA